MENASATQSFAPRWALRLTIFLGYLYPTLLYIFIALVIPQNRTARYFTALISGIAFAIFALWIARKDSISSRVFGINLPKLLESVLLIAACWAVYALVSFLLSGKSWFSQRADLLQLIQQWLFVALGEELLFRGYLFNRFQRAFQNRSKPGPVLLASLVSSAIFATYHIPSRIANGFGLVDLLISLLQVFVLGFLFVYFYLRSGSILFSTLVHGSWNVPLFGSQGNFLLLIVFAIVLEAYLFFIRKKFDKVQFITSSNSGT